MSQCVLLCLGWCQHMAGVPSEWKEGREEGEKGGMEETALGLSRKTANLCPSDLIKQYNFSAFYFQEKSPLYVGVQLFQNVFETRQAYGAQRAKCPHSKGWRHCTRRALVGPGSRPRDWPLNCSVSLLYPKQRHLPTSGLYTCGGA